MDIQKKLNIKSVLMFIIILLMIFFTMLGASAITTDGNDYFVMEAGEEKIGNFVLIGDSSGVFGFVGEGFISFDGELEKDLTFSKTLDNNAVYVEYNIKIPDEQEIGVYNQEIFLSNGVEENSLNIEIDIQKPVVNKLINFVNINKKYFLYTFLFIASIIIFFILKSI